MEGGAAARVGALRAAPSQSHHALAVSDPRLHPRSPQQRAHHADPAAIQRAEARLRAVPQAQRAGRGHGVAADGGEGGVAGAVARGAGGAEASSRGAGEGHRGDSGGAGGAEPGREREEPRVDPHQQPDRDEHQPEDGRAGGADHAGAGEVVRGLLRALARGATEQLPLAVREAAEQAGGERASQSRGGGAAEVHHRLQGDHPRRSQVLLRPAQPAALHGRVAGSDLHRTRRVPEPAPPQPHGRAADRLLPQAPALRVRVRVLPAARLQDFHRDAPAAALAHGAAVASEGAHYGARHQQGAGTRLQEHDGLRPVQRQRREDPEIGPVFGDSRSGEQP